MSICITGGGTGGHLAIAKSFAKASNELKLKYALNKLKEDIKNKEAFFSL